MIRTLFNIPRGYAMVPPHSSPSTRLLGRLYVLGVKDLSYVGPRIVARFLFSTPVVPLVSFSSLSVFLLFFLFGHMASQTVPFGIGFKLDGTLGATTIGLVAASIMYGVTCVQTYTYYHRENNDTKLLRGLVGILWVIDSLHLALILHFVYYFTVTNYFKPLALLDAPWSVGAEVVITTINDVIIRLLFAHRIWLLSKNKIITFIVVGLSIFVAAIGFALAARIDQLRAFLDLGKISWLIYLVFGGIASVDTLIATILCVLLNKLRTGHKRTDTQIQRLIVYSIHTGALTSLLAIICVICFATLPKNFVFIAVFFTLPKCKLDGFREGFLN
ncbi:hypothetical protein C8Q75DRAFT_622167 [Abortiporus biennis]|nr:hypothetical protein C8Q75DRAFT_622167 [Abortiporus biennis]